MGVYNGAAVLSETMDSVLAQEGVTLELVVVEDGSTDDTAKILAGYAARDARVRVVTQTNQGLTGALVKGCAEARGSFIARQDAGDFSLPGRLEWQAARLREAPSAAMVSCGTRIIGPRGEFLYEVAQLPGEHQHALDALAPRSPLGPSHHGATMMRREAYLAAGGYRAAFRVAQDIDLWTRLREVGECLSYPQVYYQAKLIEGSISARRRRSQIRTVETIVACSKARRRGEGDGEIVAGWAGQSPSGFRLADWRPDALTAAEFNYFVASMLRQRRPEAARHYYRRALSRWPLHLRSWLGLARFVVVGKGAAES
jgi:glycosyltransferase involved in cell wall biosynthesis